LSLDDRWSTILWMRVEYTVADSMQSGG